MKTRTSMKERQRGAVAVLVGISMVILIGLLALVIDLGHLYLAKTGLQNAADAAALSGAKQLDGTAARICCDSNSAVYMAVNTGERNTFFGDLGQKQVELGDPSSSTNSYIQFSNSPEGTWVDIATAMASPSDKFFIKVDTASQNLDTWFAPIFNLLNGGSDNFQASTFGAAVAGPFSKQIAPIAMCAIDVRQCPCLPGESNCGQGGQLCGYEPGKSYSISNINPIGPGTPVWIDAAATQADCAGGTKDTRPYVCLGKALVSTIPGEVIYTNTGLASGPLFAALDSRFGDYASAGRCDPATAPPDRNIQEYAYQLFNDVVNPKNGKPYAYNGQRMADWLTPKPDANGAFPQTSTCIATGAKDQYGANIYSCSWAPNGVYWSASRPVAVSGVAANSSYPASGTPYTQTSGSYFTAGGSGQKQGRRLLNLLVVQCESAGGECRPARNRIVGQFLLQTRANVANDGKVEFVRRVSQDEIRGEIRLYQ